MSKIAIYARKSVFREDSISIESQIELCEYEARGEEYILYSDNGYSGKNTARPDFQRMMDDVKARKISKVIVYKLDRISRSILDFSEMMELFQTYKVDFISATEHFDTSSPMGRAMLNICIVFAQLERETIQQRVSDAYASRSKKGFYMGGKVPYGYKKIPAVIDGVKTSMYDLMPEEASDIRLIYSLYSKPSATLGDVLRALTDQNLNLNRRGKYWNTARLSETIRNPVYTIADTDIYKFFKEQNTNIYNSIKDFDGHHSCYLFKGSNTNRKTWDLSGQNLVIAPHKGIVSSDVWLTCRRKLLSNHQVRYVKARNSFLSGKVKCGTCGHALVIRKSGTKAGRYFICIGKSEMHYCKADLPTIYADEFEEMILDWIEKKISTLTIRPKHPQHDNDRYDRIRELEIKIQGIEDIINSLVESIVNADKTSMMYINKKIGRLDTDKKTLENEIEKIKTENEDTPDSDELTNVMSLWDKLEFDDKRSVIELLIDKILVFPNKVEIQWRV